MKNTREIIAACVLPGDRLVLGETTVDVTLSVGNQLGGWVIRFEAYSPSRHHPVDSSLVLPIDFPVTIMK